MDEEFSYLGCVDLAGLDAAVQSDDMGIRVEDGSSFRPGIEQDDAGSEERFHPSAPAFPGRPAGYEPNQLGLDPLAFDRRNPYPIDVLRQDH